SESSQQFEERIKNDIDHQRDASSKSIAKPSKDECPEWTHHQGDSDGEGNLRNSSPKVMGDRDEDKGKKKEIKSVQGPAEETSDKSIALCTVQRFEEPDRFHAPSTKCQVERSRDISGRRTS